MPVVLVTWKVVVERLLEPRSRRLQWVKTVHSSLGNRVSPVSKNKSKLVFKLGCYKFKTLINIPNVTTRKIIRKCTKKERTKGSKWNITNIQPKIF